MNWKTRYLKLIVCTQLMALLTGCMIPFPHTTQRSPEVHGRVLDARTHAPIQGATVFLTEYPKVSCTSDADGYFRLKATHNFHLLFIVAGEAGHWPSGKDWLPYITVARTNYAAHRIRGIVPPEGDIFLKPKQ